MTKNKRPRQYVQIYVGEEIVKQFEQVMNEISKNTCGLTFKRTQIYKRALLIGLEELKKKLNL